MTSYAVELTEAALAAITANATYIAVEGQGTLQFFGRITAWKAGSSRMGMSSGI